MAKNPILAAEADPGKRLALKDRVQKHRQALRAQGLRPIQIWIPDTRKPGFEEEALRQCLAVRHHPQESEILEWIENVADYAGWV